MSYSEEQIAHAVDMIRFHKGNLSEVHRATGIARATLRKWQGGGLPKSANARKIDRALDEGISAVLAAKAEEVAQKALDAAPDRIDKATFRDLLVGAEVAIRSAALLRGKPTSRNEGQGIKVSLVVPGSLKQLAVQVVTGPQLTESRKDTPAIEGEIIREYGDSPPAE